MRPKWAATYAEGIQNVAAFLKDQLKRIHAFSSDLDQYRRTPVEFFKLAKCAIGRIAFEDFGLSQQTRNILIRDLGLIADAHDRSGYCVPAQSQKNVCLHETSEFPEGTSTSAAELAELLAVLDRPK